MRTGRSVKDGSSNFDEAVALPLIVQHINLCQCLCSNGVRKAQRALLSAVWFSPARGARKNHGGAKLLVSGGPHQLFPAPVISLHLNIPDVQLLLAMECFVFDQHGFYTIPFLRISGKSLAANHCTLNSMVKIQRA